MNLMEAITNLHHVSAYTVHVWQLHLECESDGFGVGAWEWGRRAVKGGDTFAGN